MKKLLLTFMLFIATTSLAYAEQVTVKVNGLVCDFCARALENTFSKQPEVKNIHVNLDKGLVTVHFKEGKTLDDNHLRKAVLDAGYNIETITRSENE